MPPSIEREGQPRTMRFVPDFLLRDMVGWLTAVGLLAALAAFFPWELGRKADPFAPAPAGIRPEWYFLSMFQALKYLPAKIAGVPGEMVGVFFFGMLALVLVAMPLLDRGASRGRSSPWWNRLAVVALLGALVLTVLALLPVREGWSREIRRLGSSWPVVLSAARRPRRSPRRPRRPLRAATVGCVDCHLALDDSRITPPAKAFADDVHAHAGFTCASCHGGDAKAEDQDARARSEEGLPRQAGAPRHPALCGTCHADAAAMKRFNPSLRVDQLSEYRTSGHGKELARGDGTVATCASCHGAHGILAGQGHALPRLSRPASPQTCNRCHGDVGLMTAHKLPADVFAKYSHSVHHEALTKKGDLSAPTCNTCHGNHGAAPPEVGSVANVCGTCHTVFAEQFKASPHWEAFAELGLPGCVTCHENHGIVHPTDAYLADGDDSRCASCHEPGTAGAKAAAEMHTDLMRLQKETEAARTSLRREAEAGMEVSRAQFDLSRADEALTKARADVHLFQSFAVQQAVNGGLTVARKARQEGARLHREREFRRKGLFVSLVLIVVAITGLVLKIRDLDRRRPN